MEIIYQPPERTMGLADYSSRHPSDYSENEWSKNSKELWENWFVVNSVENVNENHERQQRANQRLNKLFKQPMRAQNAESEKEMSETADRPSVKANKLKRVAYKLAAKETPRII